MKLKLSGAFTAGVLVPVLCYWALHSWSHEDTVNRVPVMRLHILSTRNNG